jgi:hypothetical protein
MTTFNKSNNISNFKAGADLSAATNKYLAVKFDGSGDIVLCGAGELAVGFLFNLPALGDAAEVATLGGGALGISNATIAAGVLVKSDANGKLVAAATADDLAIARTMKASVANDVVEVQPVLVRIHA